MIRFVIESGQTGFKDGQMKIVHFVGQKLTFVGKIGFTIEIGNYGKHLIYFYI